MTLLSIVVCVFAVVGFGLLWAALRNTDGDRLLVLPTGSTEHRILESELLP